MERNKMKSGSKRKRICDRKRKGELVIEKVTKYKVTLRNKQIKPYLDSKKNLK